MSFVFIDPKSHIYEYKYIQKELNATINRYDLSHNRIHSYEK